MGLSVVTGLGAFMSFGAALAQDGLGLPQDKSYGLQAPATEVDVAVHAFHDGTLMPMMIGVSVFVLALLIWIVVRYNKRANPVAAKFSHNTLVEVIWTVGPVLILMIIAFQSFALLRKTNDMPKPDVLVKAVGNQWYWTYSYPEQGVSDFDSRLLPAAMDLKLARAAKIPYLLEVDNPMIVPVGKVVHVEVTGTDVIHAFAMPSFGIKIDAIPGRLNHTWFKASKIGTYYGQCSELCGVDHGYMPIQIKVVSEADYDAFIVKSGGKTKAMLAAEVAPVASAPVSSAPVASSAPAVDATASSSAASSSNTSVASATKAQ